MARETPATPALPTPTAFPTAFPTNRRPRARVPISGTLLFSLLSAGLLTTSSAAATLESSWLRCDIEDSTGRWSLLDKRSGARWPTTGTASLGAGKPLTSKSWSSERPDAEHVRLRSESGATVVFELHDGGRQLVLRYEGEGLGEIRVLGDALGITDTEDGYAIVPCREGLLVSASSGVAFRRTFGTSDYEGSHMNMIGLVKGPRESGSTLIVSWDDAYVFPELASEVSSDSTPRQRLTTTFTLRRSARSLTLTPSGRGDWNTIAAAYRRIAESKGLAVTLTEKIRRNPRTELMVGAANVKLWTCLARRMNEESTREESVKVHWTFDEAARIAEHLQRDLGLERSLFMLGGWTQGGYDCRHPDNLPANPECGGDAGLTDAIGRIQALGYVACLHDNYQDMYRDAASWDEGAIEKKKDGSLVTGGRWLGGRAYMVCAPRQLDLAKRPQGLTEIHKRFPAWSYFIDTTYAVGPRECHDPEHPLDRNQDIAWKKRLSDYSRDVFGLFGSECGREWALPHSDFFEGLVAVSGRHFHSLVPAELGATVIPFWEMVYHDCQICYGKYGYAAERAADYVAHHVLCARPLHYHSIPDHLYWETKKGKDAGVDALPRITALTPTEERTFRISYSWDVREKLDANWRVFVHFDSASNILFQDDHVPPVPTSRWKPGEVVEIGPRLVTVPRAVRQEYVDVFIGLFDAKDNGHRIRLAAADSQQRVRLGRLRLGPTIEFEPATPGSMPPESAFLRSSGGWAEGKHPLDVFIKNTHEVLGPLHARTAHDRLTRFELLDADGHVRRAVYGEGDGATTVVVNLGPTDAEAISRLGGRVTLPRWGFVVDNKAFAAFYATRWGDRDYEGGALFTLRALDDKPLESSARVRVFHGFGDPKIRWSGQLIEVSRERVLTR